MKDKGEYKFTEEETKWQSFRKILWNSETNECLGRTGLSWFRITIFYIIFYACLAAFWSCMLVIFFQILENDQRKWTSDSNRNGSSSANDRPKWTLDSSRIGSSPGLGFRPSPPKNNTHSTLIWFNATRNETVEYWVDNLKDFLKPYETHSERSEDIHCIANQTTTADRLCHFPIIHGIENICSPERNFGYLEGKPCVLIKLNRIYDWKPDLYEDGAPADLRKHLKEDGTEFDKKLIYITCSGENTADRENIGEVKYYPIQGIHSQYFPFKNQDGYVSPFVFAQFNEIARGVLVSIECRAWARNINFSRKYRLGSVHFELLVD